ncbi:MAG: hypothetical protein L0I24_01065 [Pseudonocardia sp.]|nr:hypothetical protein [Pseudonocardia sp.]
MKFYDHPSTHGHHVNPHTCRSGHHRVCDGFSGGYDTYICGCCCHDRPQDLSDEQRAVVDRLLSEATS